MDTKAGGQDNLRERPPKGAVLENRQKRLNSVRKQRFVSALYPSRRSLSRLVFEVG